jgi:hypothetical protein
MRNIVMELISFRPVVALIIIFLAALPLAGCSGSSSGGVFPAKTLIALTADKYEDTVEISAKYDFGRLNTGAHYSDGEIRAVAAKWYLDSVEVDIDNFYAPGTESVVVFNARYSDGEVIKTIEVKLNAVKAVTAVYFSRAADSPESTCEVFSGYNSPVLKFVIGSPRSEALAVNKLSFVIPSISEASMIDSAVISAGAALWRASILSGGVIEFNFNSPRLSVPKNSVVDVVLSINFNQSAAARIGLSESYALLSNAAGGFDIRGEFFGARAMDNIEGLPLRSGVIALKAGPAAVNIVEAPASGEKYSPAAISFQAGAMEGFAVKDYNPAAEELSFIVTAKAAAGSYSLRSLLRQQLSAAVGDSPVNAAGKGVSYYPAFDGQLSSDMDMRALERKLLGSGPAPDYINRGGGCARPGKSPVSFKAGDLETFHVINVKNYQWHTITAEVTAAGDHCYIFEEIDMAPRYKKLTKEKAAEIAFRFDNDIYSKVTGVFGEEPNPGIDGDSKIFILFTRIVNEGTALGYFSAMNQYKRYNEQGVEQHRYSNEKEIIFSAVRDEESEFKDENGFFTLLFNVISHEFQHLINWHQHSLNNNYEETWVNEGLSMLAEDVAGYGYQSNFYARRVAEFFAAADSYSLVEFKYLDRGSYGFSYLFFRYLYERGAVPANLVKSKKSGKENVEEEIKRAGIASDFDSAFDDFIITLYFSSKGVSPDPRYSYQAPVLKGVFDFAGALKINIDGIRDAAEITAPAVYNAGRLNGYGFNIIKFNPSAASSDNLNLYFTNTSTETLKIIPLRFKKL